MTHALLSKTIGGDAQRVPSIAIEGWRGINHSFALVNQHQILELLKLDALRLFHRDLPFAFSHWTRAANGSGFSPVQQAMIDGLPSADGEKIDCIYRICSPFRTRADDDRCKIITFMVTELGLQTSSFEDAGSTSSFTRDDNRIVTPSRWSRERLVEWGFPDDKIDIIPHGVDSTVFTPLPHRDRRSKRLALGLAEDETVFLNVGLPTWNKGIDLLLAAFATLRAAGRKVRLILKDQRDLYGCSMEALIRTVGIHHPALLTSDTLGAISVIPTNLGREDLRTLFAVADRYVSPYRAEGFNLPVLEAIACGTPVIVPRGGATDDFCTDDVATRIRGVKGRQADLGSGLVLCHIEPALNELIEAMDASSVEGDRDSASFETGRLRTMAHFSWQNAASRLAHVMTGLGTDEVPLQGKKPKLEDGPYEISSERTEPANGRSIVISAECERKTVTSNKTTMIHQIYITDRQFDSQEIPDFLLKNRRNLSELYPHATLTVWRLEDLRNEIRSNFDISVLDAFDMLQPYAFKADLGRLCLLYLYGGLYVDVGIRFINPLDPPVDVGIATFAGPWNGSPTWVAMTNGIIWSRPRRRELTIAIQLIVESCKTKFYGKNCLYPTGPVCLGRAFAIAMTERIGKESVDDQWIGIQRPLTPELENKNWCFVAPDSTLVATSIKKYPSDLSHLGARGTNSYFQIWSEKNVYGENPGVRG